MEDKILNAIKEALGSHEAMFVISLDETLVIEDDYQSYNFAFAPRAADHPEYKVTGDRQSLQIDVDEDGELSLIQGEDTQIPLTRENIYCQLYWHEATEAT